jgi:hypothetical protein
MKRITSFSDPEFRDFMRKCVKSKGSFPLLPRHDIYLSAFAGDGRRFAANFRAAWERLPLNARRKLLGYWTREGLAVGVILSPIVELVEQAFLGRRDFAVMDRQGHRLRFSAKFMDRMPDDVVRDIIGHEFAHCHQAALGIRCNRRYADGRAVYICRDGSVFGGNFELEEDADLTMHLWGFDPESPDRWAEEVGIRKTKTINTGDPKKDLAILLKHLDRKGR